METKHGILVLADISGYTRFTRMHFTSLLHAEEIITELLEAVIQAADFPLQVSQLEGDAVLLFAEVQEGHEKEAALDVTRQIRKFFEAFNLRERALIACDAGCVCDACNQVGQLRLKAVLHLGAFTVKRIREVETLAGADVEIVRRLIKSQVPLPEFVLMTRRFYELSGGLEDRPPDKYMEAPGLDESIESIPVVVYFPRTTIPDPALPPGAGPALSGRLNQHAFARMFGLKPRADFNHLAGGPSNLVIYLLEGTLSGFNLLRKSIQPGRQMEIKPVALVLVEISADPALAKLQNPETRPVEQFITALLKATIDNTHPPLTLNKLEGEAALLYAIADNGDITVARNVAWQAQELFKTFQARAEMLAERQDDPASAHKILPALRFRILLHFGQAAFKTIEHFQEIAGQDVILVHRLLKNSVSTQEYALMTERFYRLSGGWAGHAPQARTEMAEGLGDTQVWVFPFSRGD